MSSALTSRRVRLRRLVGEAGAALLGIVLLMWTLTPVYRRYQFVLPASDKHMTAAVMQAQLFDDADPPRNAMMTAAIIYALPPVAIFFALRRTMMAGLTR